MHLHSSNVKIRHASGSINNTRYIKTGIYFKLNVITKQPAKNARFIIGCMHVQIWTSDGHFQYSYIATMWYLRKLLNCY